MNQQENLWGVAGFTLSICGLLTCGLLCVPALFVSLAGLCVRGSKGLAIAGLAISIPGTILFFVFGIVFILSLAGPAASSSLKQMKQNEKPIQRLQ